MKRLIAFTIFLIIAIVGYSQSGISTFKYETRFPSIRVGGATKVKLDSITQNVDTIKFYNGATELVTNGAGIWTGSGIRLDTTLARVTLGVNNVTNESKMTMFSSPSFTGTSTFSGSLIPSLSATYYFGSNDNRWNGIYFANSAFMNWANNISISGINDRLEFIGGDLDLNNNNLYSTGDIGTDLSRVNHLYVDSLFSNYSDIILTGYAPLNSPTFTGIVTMPNTNLPSGTSAFLGGNINSYINFSEFQIDINAHVDLGDYDLWANYIGDETDRVEGGYFGFVAADTIITQSVGIADSVVSYGFFDNLSINNRPTVGAASVALQQDIADSLTAFLDDATIGVALADSNIYNGGYATRTYVESLLGSGTGMSTQRLPFIIGTTAGAPSASDSTITHSEFSGKHINLYRDGALQYQNSTATNTVEGFRLNSNVITVNPVWQAGEQVLIDITDPILWSSLSIEGEESTLLTGLSGYWKLDETSGTTATDATGTQNGVSLGTVGVTGKIGYANSFDAAAEVVRIPYNESIVPSGSAFSVSLWVWFDSIPSTVTGLEGYYLFNQMNSASPYEPQNIQFKAFNDRLYGVARNTSGTQYDVINNVTLSDSAWHHVVLVVRGDSQTLQLYVDGTDVSTSAETFTGTLFEANSYTCFGNAYSGASQFVRGKVDECAIWSRALTSGEVSTLYNSGNGITYPFN